MSGLKKIFGKVFSWAVEARFRASDLWLLALYGVVIGFGLWHHEPWSDEAFPWLIARDADWREFFEIIFRNWDRHPGLFYTLLLPLAKSGLPYFSQAVLNGLFSLAAAYLFMAKAPLPRIFRYLFLFSYYMLYEYSVITRTYMLSVLLIFCVAAFYPKRAVSPVLYATLVAMLFQSDYMCFGLGVGLTLGFVIENKMRIFRERRIGLAFGIMAVSAVMVFGIGHSLPPDHPAFGAGRYFSPENLPRCLADAFFPFSDLGPHGTFQYAVAVLGGAAILGLVFVSLVRTPVPAVLLGASLGNLFLIFVFLHRGDYRHHGFVLVSVLFALWISAASSASAGTMFPRREESFRKARVAVLVIAGLFLALGLKNIFYIYALEYSRYFSGAKIMAEAIKEIEAERHLLKKGFVLVAKHRKSIGLLPYLPGVKFWNPCAGGYVPYYKAGKALASCDDLSPAVALQLAKHQLGDLGRTLFLSEQPLPFTEDKDYRYQKIAAVDQRVFGYKREIFFLYYPQRKPGGKRPE